MICFQATLTYQTPEYIQVINQMYFQPCLKVKEVSKSQELRRDILFLGLLA